MTSLLKPLAAVVAATSLTLLAGCSADTTTAAEATTSASAPAADRSAMPDAAPGVGRMPGTFGLIAEVQDTVLQVQGNDGQTAVTITDDTTFTRQTSGTVADIAVGDCVTGAATEADDGTLTVMQLTVIEPVDGECQGFAGGFGGGGERPTDMPSDLPSDAAVPSDLPSDMPSNMPGGPDGQDMGGSFVSGTVTTVDGSNVTVASYDGAETTVAVADDATVTATVEATSADAVAGLCASAQGDTDDTGAVTATSIALSDAVDGECSFGGGLR